MRDGWDTPKPELEAKITALLGVRWTAPIDVGMVYSYAKDGFAKENPGKLFAQYVLSTVVSASKALICTTFPFVQHIT